jgi:hypothetical protein
MCQAAPSITTDNFSKGSPQEILSKSSVIAATGSGLDQKVMKRFEEIKTWSHGFEQIS